MEWTVIVIGIISSLLAAEFYLWFPYFAEKLLYYHASRLPSELSSRMHEEWSAVLADIPGNFAKLVFAFDLYRGTSRIIHEYYHPHCSFRPAVDFIIRFLDIFFVSIAILIGCPLYLLIAIAIKIEDGGSIFYQMKRIGLAGKTFRCLKLRTIHVAGGINEFRMTHVGSFLRATALDEGPMLFSILRGNMSFVGPCALDPDLYDGGNMAAIDNSRHAVRPGMTGLAQVYAPRGISRRDRVRYDLLYIRHRSVLLNFKLILLSLWITVRGRWSH